jgi:TPR repeat protein
MKNIALVALLISLSHYAFCNEYSDTLLRAEKGDVDAQFDIATMYDLGEGVERDLVKAAKWYRQAAEQGEVAAQYNLAIMYDMGEGVTQDIVQAYAWMSAAEMFGYQGAKESSKDFLVRMTPEQKTQGEALVIKIVQRITNKDDLSPMLKKE